MIKYQNIKNQKVATVIGQNEKTKTTMLEYEDGKTFELSPSTLKRWWKKIEDTEEVAGDGTPLAEVGKEIAAQAKAKAAAAKKGKAAKQDQDEVVDTKKELAKKAMKEAVEKQKAAAVKADKPAKPAKEAGEKKASKKAPKEMQPHVKEGLQFIFDWAKKQKDEVFSPANGMNMRTLKTGGHMYCKIDFANKGFRIAFKSAALPKNAKSPDRTLNHMFDYVYIFDKELTAKDKDFLTKALTSTREYRITRNNAAAGKGKKEDK